VAQFSRDFALATGLKLEFIDELGWPTEPNEPFSPLCPLIQRTPARQRFCQQTHNQVLSAAVKHPSCSTCNAGCVEAAVPPRASGMVIGYLKFSGVKDHHFAVPDVRRIRHLLRKASVVLDDEHFT